jgi:hypothetical protein
MDLEPKRAESKKTYEPPQLTTISLRPEEAVLGNCKIIGGGSGNAGTCNVFIGGCPNQGS